MYKEIKFKELSDWIMVDGYCSTRIKINGHVNNIADRVAFIEKTPRVRVCKYRYAIEDKSGIGAIGQDRDAWIYGDKGCAPEYGEYEPSREWCDNMLKILGWK